MEVWKISTWMSYDSAHCMIGWSLHVTCCWPDQICLTHRFLLQKRSCSGEETWLAYFYRIHFEYGKAYLFQHRAYFSWKWVLAAAQKKHSVHLISTFKFSLPEQCCKTPWLTGNDGSFATFRPVEWDNHGDIDWRAEIDDHWESATSCISYFAAASVRLLSDSFMCNTEPMSWDAGLSCTTAAINSLQRASQSVFADQRTPCGCKDE